MPDREPNKQWTIVPHSAQAPGDLQEMFGSPPGWLLRSGIGLVLGVLLLGVALCWLIRYPDKLEARLVITSEAPPIDVIAPLSAYLDTLLVADEEEVEAGRLLGILESAARWEDIRRLEAFLAGLPALPEEGRSPTIPVDLSLGSLSAPFADFRQNYQDLLFYIAQRATADQIEAIRQEISHIERLSVSYRRQLDLFDQEFALLKKDFQRTEILRRQKAVSDLDLETKEGQLRQFERQREQMQSLLIQNQIRIEQLRSQQFSLQHQREEGIATRRLHVQQSLGQLQGALMEWRKIYCLEAPVTGAIIFEPGLAVRQFQTAGNRMFTILPPVRAGDILGRCQLPAVGAGKIGIGSSVQIHLEAYPYKEYGAISTQVTRIAPLPEEDGEGNPHYLVEVRLTDPLTTTYGQEIRTQPEMTGRAFLLTQDRRLLERLFEQLLNLLKNR